MQSVVVSGGSGVIGRAIVTRLIEAGYAVAFGYRDGVARAEALVAELGSGAPVAACQLDVTNRASVDSLFERASLMAPLHGLVNVAAISGPRQAMSDLDPPGVSDVFMVNVVGSLICAQAFLENTGISRGGKGGAIVNFSSQAAQSGGYRLLPYAASKGAVETMTVSMASELGAEGIRVNAVSPGIIQENQGTESEDNARRAASIPLGRFGAPEEVGDVVVWLLSDESRYVTGAVVPVNGGRRT